jgi:hypothetical protein
VLFEGRPMIRVLMAIALAAISAAAGYLFGQRQPEFTAAFKEYRGQQLTNGSGMQCNAVAGAILIENRLGGRTVTGRASPGSDTASLKIAPDGQSVSFLTGASARTGDVTDIDPMPVIGRTPSFIVVSLYDWPTASVLMIDLDTRNVLWTTTGFSIPGLIGESLYFECR